MVFRKLVSWFTALNKRERVLVGSAIAALVLTAVYLAADVLIQHQSKAGIGVEARKLELARVQQATRRYRMLNTRLETLRSSYAEKELSLEEVYSKLDQIVKDSVGGDNYELKRKESDDTHLEFDQHNFQLTVKTITLDELVKLLFALERGDEPLFLKKVTVMSRAKGKFQATLLLYSIQSKKA